MSDIHLPLWGDFLARLGYNKEHEYGLYTEGQTTLFVTRGVGMEGLGLLRMRFRCPPEIVSIELGE
ncbi:MAG: hypothetical protein ACOYYS_12065 [Chloroflexota bacterium]